MATRRAPASYKPDLPPGCTLRSFEEGDEEGLLVLLNAAFGGKWPGREIAVRPLEHLRWKLRSHDLATAGHAIAEQEGRMIAARLAWVSPLKADDRVVLAQASVDLAVLPEFQGQRVMTALLSRTSPANADRFEVAVGTGNTWQSVNFVPGSVYRRTIDVVARPLARETMAVASVPWTLRPIDAFDSRVDDLWRHAAGSFRLIFQRTAERLNYRFADRRAGRYSIVVAEHDGQVLGYVIYSSVMKPAQIVDLLVLPGRFDVLESLLVFALDHLRRSGSASVECWRFLHHLYRPVLEKLGFDEPKGTRRITVHWLHGKDDPLVFFADPKSSAHFMSGDTDLV